MMMHACVCTSECVCEYVYAFTHESEQDSLEALHSIKLKISRFVKGKRRTNCIDFRK